MASYRDILRQYWGYDSFRPLQEDIIESVGSGRDTLALLPTGGGKSICFQVPAMARDGLCLVITPLIALMQDQVQNLRDKGIKATAIYTGITLDQLNTALDNCRYGDYKFLYVSPERLESESFLLYLKQMPVSMIAVDEAHCISQWGYDFRPAYLNIAKMREHFPEAPILALTATATPDVVEDIQKQLLFREKNVFKSSFARQNLSYVVRHTEDKLGQMLRILNGVPGTSIVYVRNRQKTKEVAEWLLHHGISATNYHAGLTDKSRRERQEQWKRDEVRVMVATNAFGMGIDKPQVRTVIHLDLPDSIEAYFQEAGRAGRDGEQAYAVLLYNPSDKGTVKRRVSSNYPARDFICRVYEEAANWLQVGIESGMGHTFSFPIDEFCQDRRLPVLQTYSALQILHQSGYIRWQDEHDQQPRVLMLTTRDELYDISFSHDEERLLNSIMRNYTGIFAEFQYINDDMLAKELTMDKQKLNEYLVELAKRRILKYIPRSHTPSFTYLTDREDTERLVIRQAVLEDRQSLFERKLLAMIEYAEQQSFCRSQVLLSYFGETDAPTCSQCDVCRAHRSFAERPEQ